TEVGGGALVGDGDVVDGDARADLVRGAGDRGLADHADQVVGGQAQQGTALDLGGDAAVADDRADVGGEQAAGKLGGEDAAIRVRRQLRQPQRLLRQIPQHAAAGGGVGRA